MSGLSANTYSCGGDCSRPRSAWSGSGDDGGGEAFLRMKPPNLPLTSLSVGLEGLCVFSSSLGGGSLSDEDSESMVGG